MTQFLSTAWPPDHQWLVAHGSRLMAQGQENESGAKGPGPGGAAPRMLFRGHEQWAMSFELRALREMDNN